MSDNPFSGPDENERTIIRSARPAAPPPQDVPADDSERTVIRASPRPAAAPAGADAGDSEHTVIRRAPAAPPPNEGPPEGSADDSERTVIRASPRPAAPPPSAEADDSEHTVIRRGPAAPPPEPVADVDDGERTVFRPSPGGRRPPAVPAPPVDDGERTVFRPSPGGRRPVAPPQAAASDDGEHTVFRPSPGGRRAAIDPVADMQIAEAPFVPAALIGEEVETVPASGTPLVAAAAPLLQLLARLRNTARQPDAAALRERAAAAIQTFEQAARELGTPPEILRPAHFTLCASIDDIVVNTPWGGPSGWAAKSLVATFHADIGDSDRLFDMLGRLRANPAKFLPLLELIYLCLSLGFMGRYRRDPNGVAEMERLREETYAIITTQRKAAETLLSPRWEGVSAPYAPARARVPLWVVGAVALAVCGGLFAWVSSSLNAASDDHYAQMLAAAPGHMPQITRAAPVQPPPPPPAPPEPTVLDRLQAALKPEIDKGLVSVLGTATSPVLRIGNRVMFPGANATLQQSAMPLLERVGTVLKDEPGTIRVIGYTDNQPIHTVKFPSNFQLSTARAEAARAVVARTVGDKARVGAEGRADEDPVAANTTAEGREQNRRIEIVLHQAE